jgi:hypothetical protein
MEGEQGASEGEETDGGFDDFDDDGVIGDAWEVVLYTGGSAASYAGA